MFVEVITRRGEKVFLNINHILFATQQNNGVVIFDVSGNGYYTEEPYSSFVDRLNRILNTR